MERYIDVTQPIHDLQIAADALRACFGDNAVVADVLSVVIDGLNKCPTADVAPVVHGEWVPAKTKEAGLLFGLVECSRCLTRIPERYSTVVSWCPQCGAYMNSQRG